MMPTMLQRINSLEMALQHLLDGNQPKPELLHRIERIEALLGVDFSGDDPSDDGDTFRGSERLVDPPERFYIWAPNPPELKGMDKCWGDTGKWITYSANKVLFYATRKEATNVIIAHLKKCGTGTQSLYWESARVKSTEDDE